MNAGLRPGRSPAGASVFPRGNLFLSRGFRRPQGAGSAGILVGVPRSRGSPLRGFSSAGRALWPSASAYAPQFPSPCGLPARGRAALQLRDRGWVQASGEPTSWAAVLFRGGQRRPLARSVPGGGPQTQVDAATTPASNLRNPRLASMGSGPHARRVAARSMTARDSVARQCAGRQTSGYGARSIPSGHGFPSSGGLAARGAASSSTAKVGRGTSPSARTSTNSVSVVKTPMSATG